MAEPRIDRLTASQRDALAAELAELEDEQGGRIEGEISIVGGTGAISPDSPLGRALIGRREGDAVEVEAPRGTWTARIVSIRRS